MKQDGSDTVLTEAYVKERYNSSLRAMEGSYTDRRWFASVESAFDYAQTKRAFLHALGTSSYPAALEIGPGDAVWTPYVLKQVGDLELLDQSEEMLGRAKEKLKDATGVTFTQANIAEHIFGTSRYNLIFGIRCFEYVIDKAAAIQKFHDALTPGGRLIIITKNPNYLNSSGWKNTLMHTKQIGKRELTAMLRRQGFIVEGVYPAVMRWKSSYALSRWIFRLLQGISVVTNGRIVVPWLTDRSTESYTFVARKQPVVVELYGLSGSGKSTLAKELVSRDPAITLVRPKKSMRGLAYFILHNPKLFFSWVGAMCIYALFHNDRALFRHRLAILLSTFASYGLRQDTSTGIALHDEGLFQRVFSIRETRQSPEDLVPFLRLIPPTHLVVIVDRPDNQFERYSDPQTQNPRALRGEAYLSAWKEMILYNHESLKTALKTLAIPTHTFTPQESVELLSLRLKAL